MVCPERLELSISWFVAKCIIPLCYGHAMLAGLEPVLSTLTGWCTDHFMLQHLNIPLKGSSGNRTRTYNSRLNRALLCRIELYRNGR